MHVWNTQWLGPMKSASLPRVIMPNLIAVSQTVRAYVWRSAWKLGTSRPAIQGHRNLHRL